MWKDWEWWKTAESLCTVEDKWRGIGEHMKGLERVDEGGGVHAEYLKALGRVGKGGESCGMALGGREEGSRACGGQVVEGRAEGQVDRAPVTLVHMVIASPAHWRRSLVVLLTDTPADTPFLPPHLPAAPSPPVTSPLFPSSTYPHLFPVAFPFPNYY